MKLEELNQTEIDILDHLINSDPDFGYQYWWFEEFTGMKREQLKPIMTKLRHDGWIEHMKGLMNDDGEVAGSGFNIVYGKRREVREFFERIVGKES